ncbi:hypothetical protein J7E95_28855, partial [Streptomyces sp. ISL-14]|nr:hypothetical protein [Streptomyces sp. ISL-14]
NVFSYKINSLTFFYYTEYLEDNYYLLSACLIPFSILLGMTTSVACNFKGAVSNFQEGINASILGVVCGQETRIKDGFRGV